jgi:Tol biopolymer transport system component
LTNTPDVDETDPDVNRVGLVVYRQAPAGTPLDERGAILVMDTLSETVTALGLTGRTPAWSPDGRRIALMSDLEGGWQVYVYDLNQKKVWRASQACPTHCRFPAFSPDGQQILFSTTTSENNLTSNGLWMVPAAGGRPRRWLRGPYERPSWSQAGQIAFAGPGGIYLAQAGRAPTPTRYLFRDPTLGLYSAPVWSR